LKVEVPVCILRKTGLVRGRGPIVRQSTEWMNVCCSLYNVNISSKYLYANLVYMFGELTALYK
jgi:4-diphosphocytidyl-2C-methyl-D-erythritol kinase